MRKLGFEGIVFCEPFVLLGEGLCISAVDVIERVTNLKNDGIIRRISGVFDSSKLGYHSTLAAMHIPESRLDEAAAVINEHRGVSHNYSREHHYNLWFTLTLAGDKSLPEAVDRLAELAGVQEVINLPAIRVFKSRVFFDMVGEGAIGNQIGASIQDGKSEAFPVIKSTKCLSRLDRSIVKQMQTDLPIKKRAFDEPARRLNLDTSSLLARAKSMLADGTMRRYGASLNHHKAGFSANAMSCWQVPEAQIEQAGKKAASYNAVSHCYLRKTSVNWPYNLFAMIHSRSREECEETAKQISVDIDITDYIMLYTIREYKKERVRYFTEPGDG